jgi:hypothetical protein
MCSEEDRIGPKKGVDYPKAKRNAAGHVWWIDLGFESGLPVSRFVASNSLSKLAHCNS